ncbi:MAG: NADP-dependent oxidoreductase [Rhodothalassiaceae bacterium]
MTDTARRWTFHKPPVGEDPGPQHFRLEEADLPNPGPGQLAVRSVYLSVDPAQVSWMQGIADYMPPMQPGNVMLAGGAGVVTASQHPKFQAGDLVTGTLGWQEAFVSDGRDLTGQPLRTLPAGTPLALAQSVLGMTGLTAFIGLLHVGELRAGDTVLVTGAAGAVGSIAGQLARIAGAGQVIGTAGGPQKCRWVTEELGFDACIDYKAGRIVDGLKAQLKAPIDLFFDNVGGEALDAGLSRLAHGARIVICGGISGYTSRPTGPSNYLQLVLRRASMRGFVVLDHVDLFGPAIKRLRGWIEQGRLQYRLDIVEGFDALPDALGGLFRGENIGKRLVKVAEDPTA